MGLQHNIQDKDAIYLYQRGYGIQDIANILHTTYETVKYRLIKNGCIVNRNGKYVSVKDKDPEAIVDEIKNLLEQFQRSDNYTRKILCRRLKRLVYTLTKLNHGKTSQLYELTCDLYHEPELYEEVLAEFYNYYMEE